MVILPEVERQNSAVSGLRRVAGESRARIAAVSQAPQFTTLADGRVLNRAGQVIFTPSPVGKVNSK